VDLNYLLIWFVGLSSVLMLYRAIGARRRGWTFVSSFVLAATVGSVIRLPAAGGYIGGAFLGLLVLIPLFGYKLVLRHTLKQEYGKARRLASFLRWLHPADGWLELPHLLRALESGDRAVIAGAAATLGRRGASRTGIGRIGIALLYRMNNQWEELHDWIQENLTPGELRGDPNMLGLYLRAHGEMGDPNALLHSLRRFGDAISREGLGLYRNMCRLFAFAFCGRKEQVARLFRSPLEVYPLPVQRFWLATADMASGNDHAAREELQSILDECDPLTAAGIARRLSHPLPLAEAVLTAEAKEILSRIEGELEQEERYAPRISFTRGRAYATYGIITLNLVVFAMELIFGGSKDLHTLYRMGALESEAVSSGEWWRVVTALFLHYGAVHLLVNMFALLLLGPFLEFALGATRYVLAYFVSGVGSMLVIVQLTVWGHLDEELLVGASGAIMGLIGATAAVLLRGWAKERARVASKRLMFILFVVVFQVVFDLATPQVSFMAHFGGVVIGFAAASLMRHKLTGANASTRRR